MDTKFEKFIESIKIGNVEEAKSNFVFEYFYEEDKYGLKPIHWACLCSNIEILEWMLQEKCNIETSSRNGWRPIHFSSFKGNEEIVKFLIEKLCDLDCKTDNGETVLDVANGDCNHDFIDEISIENINWKIGLSMGLKCVGDCKHKFCLKSLIQPQLYIIGRYPLKQTISLKDLFSKGIFSMTIFKTSDYDEYENGICVGTKINNILLNINHSKIIKYYGLIKTETKMILLMEWLNKGSLRNNLKPIKTLNKVIVQRYCRDILQAVEFLHKNKILHRFIELKRIFIDNNGGCKLALSNYSYSLADGDVKIDNEWLRKYKKYSFKAPEIVNNGILSYPYDIYRLGYTVIAMLGGNTDDDIEKSILKIDDKALKAFLKCMAITDRTKRKTATELLNDEFIRNVPVDNSNDNSSAIDNSIIKRNNIINVINNAINNKKIGSSIGLECDNKNKHENFSFYLVVAIGIGGIALIWYAFRKED